MGKSYSEEELQEIQVKIKALQEEGLSREAIRKKLHISGVTLRKVVGQAYERVSKEDRDARRGAVRRMYLDGMEAPEIAKQLDIPYHQIRLDIKTLGIRRPGPLRGAPIADDVRKLVAALVDDECPVAEIRRTAGVSDAWIRQNFTLKTGFDDGVQYRTMMKAFDAL